MITIEAHQFTDLTPEMIHAIISLKEKSFAYSQNIQVMAWDKYDNDAIHILLKYDDEFAGYVRVCESDTFLLEASFSRVCVDEKFRGRKLGIAVVLEAMKIIHRKYGHTCQIVVRFHMIEFYKKLDFFLQPQGKINKHYYLMMHQKQSNESNNNHI